ncbi:NADPH-dependent FMN reductase [Psychrobacillus vulpis]|uniref:NAD(P)H-dependent oxidoreductase n=1 Tax=Psychrobacillus vulpis TaxID=2325572 RepID=A0A544TQD5_9BACI|nr:NADPH-dependent FMN reductase [Psychrobacillus vulpis]TQR19650.1 NAD(P)H-dependent oxidoreductase [Psychrobacillus vulpis]
MKIVGIAGSIVGSKTKIAMEYTMDKVREKYPNAEVELIDLGAYNIVYSDGRNYIDYDGDTKYVTETIMAADALIIGTPTFQASIPGTLKNIFDLLPENAFREKVVSMVVTAGTSKHFLMVEQQLKPILAYMKATIVPTYVFVEEQDFHRKEIVNDDVHFRINRLVDDTVQMMDVVNMIREAKEAAYDF